MQHVAQDHRQNWIDIARGIGVILVVYGHVLGGLVRAGLFPAGTVASLMDYTLYTFHMPLFFFLAGLNVPHSLAKGDRPFLMGKLWTIAYPYVLWSLIQGGIIMVFSKDANIPIYPGDLAAIGYRPIGQFWFLYALMICHVLAVVIQNRILFLALAICGFIGFETLSVRPDLSLTLHHLPLYVAGIFLSSRLQTPMRSSARVWFVLAALLVGFAGAVTFGGVFADRDPLGSTSLPACVLGISGTVLFSKLLEGRVSFWLCVVGRMSMTIYVLHILISSAMRLILVRLHIPLDPVVYLLSITAAGVVLPMAVHAILDRIHLLGILGLAPLRLGRTVQNGAAR